MAWSTSDIGLSARASRDLRQAARAPGCDPIGKSGLRDGQGRFRQRSWHGEAVQPLFAIRCSPSSKAPRPTERREGLSLFRRSTEGRLRTGGTYLLALSASDSYKLSQIESRTLQSHETEIKEKIKSQLANSSDLDEVQARYGLARSRMVSAAAAVSEAFSAIERIAGINPDGLMPLRASIPVPRPTPDRTPTEWVNAMLQSNPELLAADETVVGAQADYEKAGWQSFAARRAARHQHAQQHRRQPLRRRIADRRQAV